MRVNKKLLAAGLVTVGLGLWLASGDIIIGGTPQAEGRNGDTPGGIAGAAVDQPAFRVEVIRSQESDRQEMLTASGRTQALAHVEVKAETMGRIVARPAEKGQTVREGDVLCRLDPAGREARVAEAAARVAQAEADFSGAQRLAGGGYGSDQRVRETRALLDGARAALKDTELELARATIAAPLTGIVQDPIANVGDMLAMGQTCATVVTTDPMRVLAQISERDIAVLSTGQEAQIRLVSGESVAGTLVYIAPTADPDTRTFRVEFEVGNEDGAILDGMTAQIRLPLTPSRAHKIAPSALSLADDGTIGVKVVDEEDRVTFLPVRILGDDGDGMWVSGLPESVDLITVGHEYVSAGSTVAPVRAQAQVMP